VDKKRIDVYLFENGLAPSREKAKSLVMAGVVCIDGKRCDKPSVMVTDAQEVSVKQKDEFVSRGGKKLKKAVSCFDLDLSGKVAIDVGASTGGFTDCMLQNGAKYVYAVDVGYGQLAWSLRNDERVGVMERTNARHMQKDMFEKQISFASIDVSFISLKLILPALLRVLTKPFTIVALVKPQFEAGRGKVGKKGVVRDSGVHVSVIDEIIAFAQSIGLVVCGLDFSPIKGPEGNIEYLLCLTGSGEDANVDSTAVVNASHQDAI
jgi:23S rRNA (cytidine1920-2'-O)/16S rRNA (cytidine1409-2'-O)-methyltransferase